ncbi:MAG: hypothetical protein JWM17_2667 [Actinobacteria bacterium]|nr:hypothetical protein [Actinomycetota bacterium]MEA2592138.1 hypothetical protein [Actinomycetota bacterium]
MLSEPMTNALNHQMMMEIASSYSSLAVSSPLRSAVPTGIRGLVPCPVG